MDRKECCLSSALRSNNSGNALSLVRRRITAWHVTVSGISLAGSVWGLTNLHYAPCLVEGLDSALSAIEILASIHQQSGR